MTQEFIDKHMAEICHYLGHPILERTVVNPTVMEFFHSMAWCMDVCGAPRPGVGFFILDREEWMEVDNWLHSNMFFAQATGRGLYANMRNFDFDGYKFTIVRKYNQ
jgi:hypothetical protein